MPIAITLRLDPGLSAAVSGLQKNLEGDGIAEPDPATAYAPHVTIGLFREEAQREHIEAALASLADGLDPPAIKLAHHGVFPGTPAAVFLGPVVTGALLDLHSRIHAAIQPAATDLHYAVGNWVPHVTLSQKVADPGAALRALSACPLPLRGAGIAIELVRFPPVAVLASYPLSAGGT
ncbi:2'-5' RNA ligase family protein [Acuticoccus kandeliae]|uniref:2'-5' RNA ligase family protein n=1 Tax=Acuticoccus kandeliae TaxID=2073160 RepID=UPI0013001F68|nr:2'-5' RNA ligase family protein [Acuticoccus kandeliae]